MISLSNLILAFLLISTTVVVLQLYILYRQVHIHIKDISLIITHLNDLTIKHNQLSEIITNAMKEQQEFENEVQITQYNNKIIGQA